jgi:hypothetical protein
VRDFGLQLLIVAIAIVCALLALHYYRVARDIKQAFPKQAVINTNSDPVTDLIVAVEKHILLPQGETPKAAKITDLSQLANIPFFGNALVGDQVLVYCKASLSVLYSPSRDKVIDVSRQPVTGACSNTQ